MPVRAINGLAGKSARNFLRRSARSRTYSTPPPIKGWNARDSVADMSHDEAVVMDNWFPEETFIRVRKGYAEHASGIGSGNVESIMAYTGPDGTNKQFAAGNSAVYEVTSSGAVGAAEFSGLSSTQFQHAMFGNSAGNFLYIVNGSDAPRYYDGSTWTTPTITGTGLTASDLIHINVFKNRLFMIEKNTLSFWYFPISTVSGAITEFRLDGLCQLGGYLVAMSTWTRDGGDGLDDLAVFVTSMGEVIVYEGTDPASSATWSLVGVFRIGPPIGRRCMFKVGSDVVIVTKDGFSFLTKFIQGSRLSKAAAQSDRISHAVHTAVESYGSNFGWQPIFHPAGHFMLFNVPRSTEAGSVQYVSNSTTGAWCRFTGMDALCWEVCGNSCLWFGGRDGKVYQADTGRDDDGSNITTSIKTAFIYFGQRGTQKTFNAIRPNLATDGNISVALSINVDFEDRAPTGTSSFAFADGGEWDTATWDDGLWGGNVRISRNWITVTGVGNSAAIRIDANFKDAELRWNATDWLYETGGFI